MTRIGPPEVAAAAAECGLLSSMVVPIETSERVGALQLLGNSCRPCRGLACRARAAARRGARRSPRRRLAAPPTHRRRSGRCVRACRHRAHADRRQPQRSALVAVAAFAPEYVVSLWPACQPSPGGGSCIHRRRGAPRRRWERGRALPSARCRLGSVKRAGAGARHPLWRQRWVQHRDPGLLGRAAAPRLPAEGVLEPGTVRPQPGDAAPCTGCGARGGSGSFAASATRSPITRTSGRWPSCRPRRRTRRSNTGWLGRWLDAACSDPLRAISLESPWPPFLAGARSRRPDHPARRAGAAHRRLGRPYRLLGAPSPREGAALVRPAGRSPGRSPSPRPSTTRSRHHLPAPRPWLLSSGRSPSWSGPGRRCRCTRPRWAVRRPAGRAGADGGDRSLLRVRAAGAGQRQPGTDHGTAVTLFVIGEGWPAGSTASSRHRRPSTTVI